jgi:hypothetical protein
MPHIPYFPIIINLLSHPPWNSLATEIEKTRKRGDKYKETYGVRFGVFPPVGPAVPDSEMQYVAPSVLRTLDARPDTMVGVGPL